LRIECTLSAEKRKTNFGIRDKREKGGFEWGDTLFGHAELTEQTEERVDRVYYFELADGDTGGAIFFWLRSANRVNREKSKYGFNIAKLGWKHRATGSYLKENGISVVEIPPITYFIQYCVIFNRHNIVDRPMLTANT